MLVKGVAEDELNIQDRQKQNVLQEEILLMFRNCKLLRQPQSLLHEKGKLFYNRV